MQAVCFRRAPVIALCILAVAGSFLFASPALAGDDEPAPQGPTVGEAPATQPAEPVNLLELEKKLDESPRAGSVLRVLRYGPILLGLLFLGLWVRGRRRHAGALPGMPQAVPPSVPFSLLGAVLLAVVAFIAVPIPATVYFLARFGDDPHAWPMWALLLTSVCGMLPVAILIVLRRYRMANTPPEERVARGRVFDPPPGALVSTSPSAALGARLGFWCVCVAAVIVLPVALLWGSLLLALGVEPALQVVVLRMLVSPSPEVPWMIAFFGVVLAPFTEEAIFRGLLYPAIKHVSGGGVRAAWISATAVSLLFAAIHGSWFALLPLFVLAMVLTWVFEKTNSLAAVMIAHALHNLFSTIPILIYRGSL